MFCPHCGSQIAGNTAFCPSCGAKLSASAPAAPEQTAPQPVPQPAPDPAPSGEFKDYQTFSIIIAVVSFLCCGGWIGVIFGVLGIVFSSQAKSAFNSGNMTEALSKSKNARLMCILGLVMIGIGAIATVVILALYGTAIFAMIAEGANFGMLAL